MRTWEVDDAAGVQALGSQPTQDEWGHLDGVIRMVEKRTYLIEVMKQFRPRTDLINNHGKHVSACFRARYLS